MSEGPNVAPQGEGRGEGKREQKGPSVREMVTERLLRRGPALPKPMREALRAMGLEERFTERARRALIQAHSEARRLNHNYIGTEHVLLGLVESGGGAERTLRELGVSLHQARESVLFVVGKGSEPSPEDLPPTPRTKKVLTLAGEEAQRQGQNYVGTEHLLLGLVAEGEGVATGVLQTLGATEGRVRERLLALTGADDYTPEPVGTKDAVITCRVDPADLWAIDILVEAGIRSTRSDAAQWLIQAGIESQQALFEQVQGTVMEIRRLRDQARALAAGSPGASRPAGEQARPSGSRAP
jgi:ATP-dependent Clp protease ATP-binding subunit ClpA